MHQHGDPRGEQKSGMNMGIIVGGGVVLVLLAGLYLGLGGSVVTVLVVGSLLGMVLMHTGMMGGGHRGH